MISEYTKTGIVTGNFRNCDLVVVRSCRSRDLSKGKSLIAENSRVSQRSKLSPNTAKTDWERAKRAASWINIADLLEKRECLRFIYLLCRLMTCRRSRLSKADLGVLKAMTKLT
jgi:hypothetical protein